MHEFRSAVGTDRCRYMDHSVRSEIGISSIGAPRIRRSHGLISTLIGRRRAQIGGRIPCYVLNDFMTEYRLVLDVYDCRDDWVEQVT
jgi:hypothetical protein